MCSIWTRRMVRWSWKSLQRCSAQWMMLGSAGSLMSALPDRTKAREESTCLLPPGYTGELPDRLLCRAFAHLWEPAVFPNFLKGWRPETGRRYGQKEPAVYPLSQAANPPEMKFVNISGKAFNTIGPAIIPYLSTSIAPYRMNPATHWTLTRWACLPPSGSRKANPSRPTLA